MTEALPTRLPRPRSKVVIRHFPPGYTEDQFLELVSEWSGVVGYCRFVPGKRPRPLSGKPVIHGCGYLDFKDSASLLAASASLHGRLVSDSEGYECALTVILAPYQGPSPSSRSPPLPDPLSGTYTRSPAFLDFVAAHEAASRPAPIPLDRQFELMMQQERELNPWKYEKELQKQTPLIQYLKGRGSTFAAVSAMDDFGTAKKKNRKKKGKAAATVTETQTRAETKKTPKSQAQPPATKQPMIKQTVQSQPMAKQTVQSQSIPRQPVQSQAIPKQSATKPPVPMQAAPKPPGPKESATKPPIHVQPISKPPVPSAVDAKPVVTPSASGAPVRIMSRRLGAATEATVPHPPPPPVVKKISGPAAQLPTPTQPATRVYTSKSGGQAKQQPPRQPNRPQQPPAAP